MDTLEVIKKYGLSVRRIPESVYDVYEISHYKDGDEIVERKTARSGGGFYMRKMCKRTIIPDNAGHWMCKQVENTDSRTLWSIKTDNLAPTLEESVQKFLSTLTPAEPTKGTSN